MLLSKTKKNLISFVLIMLFIISVLAIYNMYVKSNIFQQSLSIELPKPTFFVRVDLPKSSSLTLPQTSKNTDGTVLISARFTPSSPEVLLNFHAVFNAFSLEGNKLISVIRRKADQKPLGFWTHEIPPNSQKHFEVFISSKAKGVNSDEYELAMWPEEKGKIYINGLPDDRPTHEPISYMTISEKSKSQFSWASFYGFANDDGTEDFARRSGMLYIDKIGTLGTDFGPRPKRRVVNCKSELDSTRTAIFVTFGQSLSSNTGQVRTTAKLDVVNLNPFDMTCYKAVDPLLGASNEGGSHWISMAEALIKQKLFDRVIIIPIGVGGTYINNWAPGGHLHRRMTLALSRLSKAKIQPTAFLWQQGEAEAGVFGYPGTIWVNTFAEIVLSLRELGFTAPVYVAQSTVCGPELRNSPEIIKAQQDVVKTIPGVRLGPNTDSILLNDRYDKCHFGAVGQATAAKLWAETLIETPPY